MKHTVKTVENMTINKVAVIGAGVMGSAIAAHLANAGCQVLLLDQESADADNPSAFAVSALTRLQKQKPPALMHKRFLKKIRPGNLRDHCQDLGQCDWVIEAIIEDLSAKQALYDRIEPFLSENCWVSSNTSTLPVAKLIEGRSAQFCQNFLITHFFNPPRYMRLVELILPSHAQSEAVHVLSDFITRKLGKTIIPCQDRPGFIANRLGTFWLLTALQQSLAHQMNLEQVDYLLSKPFGIPKTGVFGLMDLVGLDLIPLVGQSLAKLLPTTDAYHQIYQCPPMIQKMIETGYTGRKGKGGFYRLQSIEGQKTKQVIDLQTGKYQNVSRQKPASLAIFKRRQSPQQNLRDFLTGPTADQGFCRDVIYPLLAYAANLVPEVSESPNDIDLAMRLGYGWEYGPFELIDMLGADWLCQQMAGQDISVPPLLQQAAEAGFYRFSAVPERQELRVDAQYHPVRQMDRQIDLSPRSGRKPVQKWPGGSLWDVGDDLACLTLENPHAALDQQSLTAIAASLEIVGQTYRGLIIHQTGPNFSVGANLGAALFMYNLGLTPDIADLIQAGQQMFLQLRHAPFPVIGAASGMALGGGCELLMHMDGIQAHSELYMGLVETGVGLVPAWGGCAALLERWAERQTAGLHPNGPIALSQKPFELIGMAQVSQSAWEAQDMGFLRPQDRISANRDHLIADAKQYALDLLAAGYQPPTDISVSLAGSSGAAALALYLGGLLQQGKITAHDHHIGTALAHILTGTSEDLDRSADHLQPIQLTQIREAEKDAFLQLLDHPATLARIEHMLATSKPLRN